MDAVLGAVVEIFTWVGFGAGALLAGVALIAYLFDGTWLPLRAVVEVTDRGRVVRWFDHEGGVNEALLTPEQDQTIGASDWAEIFVRSGSRNRMRLTRRSPLVRSFWLLAVGLLALGVVSIVVSAILLFVRG